MPQPSELSPRATIALGALVIAAGIPLILGAFQILPMQPTEGTPAWIGGCAGALFVMAGLAVINGLRLDESPARQRLQMAFGVSICFCLAAIAAWIGFGPGERRFSTSFSMPFLTKTGRSSDWMGRAVFGLGSILVAAMGIGFLVIGSSKKK